MKKIINSTGEQYKDILTDELVLDATPTEGSFNSVTSDGVAKAIAAGGGGTEYSAGDGIAISEGEISAKLADGSGLRFDQGGLQVVHQLATPGAGDQGKVLTVTNSLGAYAWADPSGVSSATAPLSVSNGNVSLGMDSDTLKTKTISGEVRENYGTGFAGGSPFALAINNTRPITVTFNGITPSAVTRTDVGISLAYREDGIKILGYGYVTIPANATSVTHRLDVMDPAEWSSGNWRPNDSSRTYDFSMSYEEDGHWIDVPYSYASVPGGETTYELAVKNPLPSSLGTAGQVLTVNSGATGVEWATPSGGGSSYTAGDGIIIDSNDAISVSVDGSSIKAVQPTGVVANRNSFYGYISIPMSKFVGGLTDSTKDIYNIQYGVDTVPFKLEANHPDAYGCEVRLVIGCDSSFTKYAVGTVSLKYNGTAVTLANDSLTTVFNNPIEIGNSMSQRGFSDLFDFSECTFDEVFSGTDLYFKLVAWDSQLGVTDNLRNPTSQSGSTWTYWPATVTMTGSVFCKQLQASNPGLLNNTAGITDIVSVASLPASPDSHTLYLVTGV